MLAVRKNITPFQIILLGFTLFVLAGAFLLCLPMSSKTGEWTSFIDSVFTSTSAVCVTGLVVFDTAEHWSAFGQVVILLLIQTGGMGIITVASLLVVISGKKIGLLASGTLRESVSAQNLGGILKLTGFIIKGVLIIELIGAVLLIPIFCRDFGWEGVWYAFFHSVSAFCNAGFDIMGNKSGAFSSLTAYSAQPVVSITVMLLIIVGGIGFLVWEDICKYKFKISRYRTQSKIVLLTTVILIFFPALYLFFFEFEDLPLGERILSSLFQSVTTRTAGFNTVDTCSISKVGLMIMTVLMIIGGSPGSTAGGIKTTTVAVLFCSAVSVFGSRKDVTIMKRRIGDGTVKTASAVLLMYIILFMVSGIILSAVEGLSLSDCFFETASAIGTVGLTCGITPSLSVFSKIIIMGLMFFGRVGGLTLIYATIGKNKEQISKFPADKIAVG